MTWWSTSPSSGASGGHCCSSGGEPAFLPASPCLLGPSYRPRPTGTWNLILRRRRHTNTGAFKVAIFELLPIAVSCGTEKMAFASKRKRREANSTVQAGLLLNLRGTPLFRRAEQRRRLSRAKRLLWPVVSVGSSRGGVREKVGWRLATCAPENACSLTKMKPRSLRRRWA